MRESTFDKWAEFVVRFATDNLGRYRPGDWMNLRQDFQAFLEAGNFHSETPMEDFTETQFRSLQGEMLGVLESYVGRDTAGRIVETPEGKMKVWAKTRFETPISITLRHTIDPGEHRVLGNTRDAIIGRFIEILRATDSNLIMRCPQCHRIFYRKGKQVFCSHKCTNREMAQRMRKRAAEPKKTKKGSRRKEDEK